MNNLLGNFEILTSNTLKAFSDNLKRYQGGSQFSHSLVGKNTFIFLVILFMVSQKFQVIVSHFYNYQAEIDSRFNALSWNNSLPIQQFYFWLLGL